MGKVSLEGVLDSVDSGAGVANIRNDVKNGRCEMKNVADGCKTSDEIVGVEVKSAEIDCGGEKDYEIVDADGDGGEVSGFVGNCGVSGNTLTIVSDGTKRSTKVGDVEKSDSESEFEASSSSSSLSSSSSSSEDEDDDDEEEENDDDDDEVKENVNEEKEEGEMNAEEGGIRDSLGEEMIARSDEEFGKAGPIMSANEIKVLPPVSPVAVTLQTCHETLPVGVVLSIVGAQVVVEGVEKHNPLNEGSVLWITEKRSPLGIVDEIFGPVKSPYYIVRYNSDNEVPAGIQEGTLISFVPEFVNHVLNNGDLYKKGYDASGENDEELCDEAEFSDDEKEAEFKRMQKVSKRGRQAQTVENGIKNKNKAKRRGGGQWGGDQHSSTTQPNERVGQVVSNQRQHLPPPSSLDRGNCSNSLHPVQAFPGGPMFPQVTQVPGFVAPSSGVWMNGIPCQPPQSVAFPNGPTLYNLLQLQQNHAQQPYQMSPFNGMPLQQQFTTGQMLPSNFVFPGGQPSFGAGATFTPMNPMMMGQNNLTQLKAAMIQNNLTQSQAAMNMQGQHVMNFSQSQVAIEMQGQHVHAPTGHK